MIRSKKLTFYIGKLTWMYVFLLKFLDGIPLISKDICFYCVCVCVCGEIVFLDLLLSQKIQIIYWSGLLPIFSNTAVIASGERDY